MNIPSLAARSDRSNTPDNVEAVTKLCKIGSMHIGRPRRMGEGVLKKADEENELA